MDFKKLPEGTEAIDLWYTLHDAELKSVTSSITARTVKLGFNIFLRADKTASTDFTLQFEAVNAVRVQSHQNYEPEFSGRATSPEMSYEEEDRLWREHWAKGRWSSTDWSTFEKEVVASKRTIYVQNAQLFQSEKGIVILIALEDGATEIVIDAESFSTTDGAGRTFTLTELVEMGKAFWDRMRQRTEQAERA